MSKAKLKFNSNGKFKILQVSDFQDGPTQRYLTMDYVLKCVEEYKPDLIMITGDNKFSTTGTEFFKFMGRHFIRKTYDCFMKPLEKLGIPVAIVFGNHDIDHKCHIPTYRHHRLGILQMANSPIFCCNIQDIRTGHVPSGQGHLR